MSNGGAGIPPFFTFQVSFMRKSTTGGSQDCAPSEPVYFEPGAVAPCKAKSTSSRTRAEFVEGSAVPRGCARRGPATVTGAPAARPGRGAALGSSGRAARFGAAAAPAVAPLRCAFLGRWPRFFATGRPRRPRTGGSVCGGARMGHVPPLALPPALRPLNAPVRGQT
jgi:hypothetical protein